MQTILVEKRKKKISVPYAGRARPLRFKRICLAHTCAAVGCNAFARRLPGKPGLTTFALECAVSEHPKWAARSVPLGPRFIPRNILTVCLLAFSRRCSARRLMVMENLPSVQAACDRLSTRMLRDVQRYRALGGYRASGFCALICATI